MYKVQSPQCHSTGSTQPRIILNILTSHVDNGGPSWVTQNPVQPLYGVPVAGPSKPDATYITPAYTDNG